MSPRYKRKKAGKLKIFFRRFSGVFKPLIYVISLVFLGYGLYHFIYSSEFFKIREITIYGTRAFVGRADVQKIAQQHLIGKHITQVKLNELEVLLKDNFQGAKDIEISRKLPDKIIVNVYERLPLAVVTNKDFPEYYLVDEDGYILGIVDKEKTNLPQITYDGDLEVGYFIDKDLVFLYLELLGALDTNRLKASTVTVNEKQINFYINDTILVVIGRAKNVSVSVKIVSELVKQLALEGKDVSKIDLRYDKVVVEY